MAIKFEITMTNKWLYSLIAVGVLLILSIGVLAYNSDMRIGSPSIMGHSAGEIQVENSSGDLVGLQDALDGIGSSSGRESMTFEVYNSDLTTWECVDVDLEDLCGDEDGCDIRLEEQHESASENDLVRVIKVFMFMEQADMSNNHYSGTSGYLRMSGDDSEFQTGTATRHTILNPWQWIAMFNYRNEYCPDRIGLGHGPAWTDRYKFTFRSHPEIRSRIIVYD